MNFFALNSSQSRAALVAATICVAAASIAGAANDPMDHPINCATAEGDLRVLEAEKQHAQKQQALGVTALTPAGAVLGIVTGKEDEKLKMLSGDYVKKIDDRIAATKSKCNV